MTGIRRWLVLLAMAGLAASCAPATDPGLESARATIQELAGDIGSRPVGSPASARAREYIVRRLTDAGYTVHVQDTDAVEPKTGVTAHVANIIGVRAGADRDAIALVSHYDSVPDGPGAQDDALGVATCLESARRLATTSLRHTIIVLVTDGEEVGLMGARAAVNDPDVLGHVRAFLNFDGTGGHGLPTLFQTGPGLGDAVDAWAHGATSPFGTSLGFEVYRRIPNDTDFTVLETTGAYGLNFAPIGHSSAYHTDRDVPSGVADDTIAHEIASTVGVVRVLDTTKLQHDGELPMYFDVGHRFGIVYSAGTARVLGIVSIAMGAIAWVLLLRVAIRGRGVTGLLGAFLWANLAAGLSMASMIAATWLLQIIRHESTPWYAEPHWFLAELAALACLSVWVVGLVAARVPGRLSARKSPQLLWWLAIPMWTLFTVFLMMMAPGASYLTALPLLTIGTLTAISRHEKWLRVASGIVAVVVLVLWASDFVALLDFLVPLFGRLPVRTPVWLYASIITVAGFLVLPPTLGSLTGTQLVHRASPLIGVIWITLVVVLGGAASLADAYTADRPAHRAARYVADALMGQAWWEVAGSDSGLSPVEDQPAGARWQTASAPLEASLRVPPLVPPYAYRANADLSAGVAPVDVSATTVEGPDGRTIVNLLIVPRALIAARVVLPAGIVPVQSSLAGVVVNNRWMATYVAVPSAGLNVHLEFVNTLPSALAGSVVAISLPGLPLGGASFGLPTWLPKGPASWEARSIFIVKPRVLLR